MGCNKLKSTSINYNYTLIQYKPTKWTILLFHHIISYIISHHIYHITSHHIYHITSYISHHITSKSILILFHSNSIQFNSILLYSNPIILYYIILYYIILYYIILYYIILQCTVQKTIKFDKCFSSRLFKSRNIGTVTKLCGGWWRNRGSFPVK